MIDLRQRMGSAGDHRGIESKQQTPECAYDSAFNSLGIAGHLGSVISLAILRKVGRTCPMDVAGASGTPSEN